MGSMRFPLRVLFLSGLVVITNVFGNYLLSVGVRAAGRGTQLWWLRLAGEPAILMGVLLLIAFLFLRLALFSLTDMSIVLPTTAGLTYILTSLAGQFWLKETVHRAHNAGLSLLAVGVVLVGVSARATGSSRTRE